MNPSMFFVPSFLEAFNGKEENKETSIRSIIYECASGVYTCKMLQPQFCEKLVQEVENIREWMHVTRSKVFQPNTSNNSGVVLEDFGMKGTLDRLMKDFISHICAILFPDVGGCSLDSHHGYVLEYGMGNDVEEAFHVDGSEVTLNVCLGERFTGGDLFFRGQRCEKHVNTETHPGENFSLSQFPGYAIIHRGCHRNGAQPTTSGHRVNLVMWCRSSVFRELQKHEKEFKDFCWKCQRDRRERRHQWVAARKAWIVGQGDVAS